MTRPQYRPKAATAAALSSLYLIALSAERTLEEQHPAIAEFIDTCPPHPSILGVQLEAPDKAIAQFRVTPRIKEDGTRIMAPWSIPLIRAVLLFGGWLYLDQTTSKIRQQQGRRPLDYLYLEPMHMPVERILLPATAAQRVLLGDDHRDLRPSNLRVVPDSLRTQSSRQEAINGAMALYHAADAKGHTLGLTAGGYRAMLDAAFSAHDQMSTTLRSAAE